MNGRELGVLLAAVFLAGLSLLLPQNAAAALYIENDTLHNLTFSNLTAMQQSTNLAQNLTYQINITNNGNYTYEEYNLSVVNCSNLSQDGVGVLSAIFINMSQGASTPVYLYVSNSSPGTYSSCIMARHWNGSETETTWSLNSSDDGVALNSSFYPDLVPTAIHWSSAGGIVTVHNVTIANNGGYNFSGDMTVYLFWDNVSQESKTVGGSNLAGGSSYNVSFSNITGVSNGMHNLTVWVDALNNVTEFNETNNNYTASVPVLGYNVTILSVACHNGTNTAPNTNVTINVSVKYENGTDVTNLNKENFTVFDIVNGSAIDTWNSADNVFNASFNTTMSSLGIYWFNITSHNSQNYTDTKPGIHNITVQASGTEGNNSYSGNSSGNAYYYLVVPRLVVTATATSGSVTEGLTKSITINVSNTGTDSIYNVTISATGDSYLSAGTIGGWSKTNGNNVVTNASDYFTCSFTATAASVSDNTVGTLTVTASGAHNYSGSPIVQYTRSGTLELTVLNIVESGTPTDDTDGGGGGTTLKSCTSDSQCGDNESCVSNKCTTISCPNGEIMDHVCITFTYKINITSFEGAISAVSGGTNSTKVTVKNTGAQTFTAKLDVVVNNVTATVTPSSYSLDAGESYIFSVDFAVPNTTTVGDFSGNFKAYVSTSTSTYESRSFKFTVFPKDETKLEINLSYQELSALLSSLMANLSQMKASGRYNQSVLDAIESLIAAANSTLLQMKGAIDLNDYVSAQSLISQVNTSISSAMAQIDGAQIELMNMPLQYGIWFWVAISVIIIFVVGFFVYMFYPSSHVGYHPEKGFAHPEADGGIAAKLKRLFKRKKKEPSSPAVSSIAQSVAEPSRNEGYDTFHYGAGYKKEDSYDYRYPRNGVEGGGFFRRFRRKRERKTTPQMHLDQFGGPGVTEQKSG